MQVPYQNFFFSLLFSYKPRILVFSPFSSFFFIHIRNYFYLLLSFWILPFRLVTSCYLEVFFTFFHPFFFFFDDGMGMGMEWNA